MTPLNAHAWLALAALAGAMGLLLFGMAGTVRYWQAWVYVSIFLGASVFTTLYLMRRDPALLARRMRGGPFAEKEATQRRIMAFASLGFIVLLMVPALDRRFGWSAVPLSGVVAGQVLVAIGLYLVFLVYRANTFASATIEVAVDQKVITSGPYAVVRAPSDVRERFALRRWHPARARLVLGSARGPCHDAVPHLAAPRRGASPRKGLAGVQAVPAASPTPSRAIYLVTNG